VRRLRIVLALALLSPAGIASAGPPVSASPAEQPLQTAGEAASRLSFVGVLQVQWSDGREEHSAILSVRAANGSVIVKGDNAVMASPQQRLVEHAGGVWDLLWPVDQVGMGRPPAIRKYQMVDGSPVIVSSRPARVVEVHRGTALVERLAFDQETGLLLRREQFEDSAARPSRTVQFQSVSFDPVLPVPATPQKIVDTAPEAVTAAKPPSGVSPPTALADGYERIGLYRHTGVLQTLYSDGLYDLSVFQQQGRLDRHKLPAGPTVAVHGTRGRHYVWPGGHVVVWEASGNVYTAVSDAPLQQIVTAVRSLPPTRATRPLLRQLRQVCRALVQPLAD
jgi:hypothetical protein